MTNSAPLTVVQDAKLIALDAAGTADASVAEAPFDGTVTAVRFTPDAAITGATATKRTMTLENRGQAGAGTTVIATLDFITGVNATKHDEIDFTLSVVANATNVVTGDILVCKEAVTSTGTANPGGTIEVTFSRGEAGA